MAQGVQTFPYLYSSSVHLNISGSSLTPSRSVHCNIFDLLPHNVDFCEIIIIIIIFCAMYSWGDLFLVCRPLESVSLLLSRVR